jgi:MFS family permease
VRRLLLLVSSIVLVETIFFSALAPLLPHYTDELGLSKTQSGFLVASYAIGGLAAAIPAAWVATRVGVKQTVVAGLLLLAATSVLFGWMTEIWALDLARIGQGVGAAFAWTGGLTWLVAATARDRRGELIGIAMGAAVVGALIGPLVGGVADVVGTGPAFSVVAAVAVVLAVWAWRTPSYAPGERQPLRWLFGAVREPQVAAGIWFLVVPSLLFGALNVLAPLRLDEVGVAALGISAIFVASAGVEAAVSPFLGRWSDRVGRLLPLRLALVASAVVCAILPWPDSRWLLVALVGVAAVVFPIFFVPGTALLSDGAEAAGIDQAFGFALLNIGWAPGHLIGSAFAGALADALGDAGPYLILSAVCLLTLIATERGPLALVHRVGGKARAAAGA